MQTGKYAPEGNTVPCPGSSATADPRSPCLTGNDVIRTLEVRHEVRALPALRAITLTDVFPPFKLDTLLTAFLSFYGALIIPDNLYAVSNERLLSFRGEDRNAQKKNSGN